MKWSRSRCIPSAYQDNTCKIEQPFVEQVNEDTKHIHTGKKKGQILLTYEMSSDA